MASLHSELSFLLRILIASLLAAAVGWEREKARKSAGLRTHILVGLASAMFVVLTDVVTARYAELGSAVRADPTRLVMAVAMGIGFIGGGIIFVQRDREVRGVTTAASIWATSAIGAAAGLEQYVLAGGATVLALLALHTLERFDRPHGGE